MASELTCPECDERLPADAPRGLCPACLLRSGRVREIPKATDLAEMNNSFPATDPGPAPEGGLGGLGLVHPPGEGPIGGKSAGESWPSESTVSCGQDAPGALETLSETPGGLPRVRLRDTEPEGNPGPAEEPDSPELPPPGAATGKYQFFGEIARGGMGAVLKGRDVDLGRDLAVKVLLGKHRDNPDLVRRFIEEAQIAGQLQHPGVVPVYELGAFPDRRPYFAMKLVKGRTLAAVLADRREPTEGHMGLLATLHQVGQTVAFAHARGVIHRDLKPANIMVGSFGEVQVMDWGLAKILPRDAAADAGAGRAGGDETVIVTARDGSGSDLSQAGSVLGTPAYMAPEQARGEVDEVDERADVFALGSMLCEVLTGRPAFVGRTAGEIQRKAARGDLADARARLEACGADPELVTLAGDCLAPERDDRPRDASAFSGRLGGYLTSIEQRLRAAEMERAAETARAEEAQARIAIERSRRRRTVALAASLLAMTTFGGLTFTYVLQQRQARLAAADRVVGEVKTLLVQARARPEDPARWRAALAAAGRVDAAGLPREARARLIALTRDARAGVAASEADRDLLDKLVDIRSAEADDPDGSTTDAAYADAFRAAGYDIDTLGPGAAGARIRSRPGPIALALAAALDDWTSRRRLARPKDAAAWRRLAAAARAADPDPRRVEVRSIWEQPDRMKQRERLRDLAWQADVATWPVQSLNLLAAALDEAGDADVAAGLLRRAAARHAGDVWINYNLAGLLERAQPPRRDEAIRYYTAARALRPETAHMLAHALQDRGDTDEAIALYRDLNRLRPENGRHLLCLGRALQARDRPDEARAARDAAVTALREEIRLKHDDDAPTHITLGNALMARGKPDEAEAAYRDAIRLKPDEPEGHQHFSALAHYKLGLALQAQRKLDEAAAAFRDAIRLRLSPDLHEAHFRLGLVLQAQGRSDEAAAAYREVIRLKRDDAVAHYNLGHALQAQGENAEAAAAYRDAIRLKRDYAEAHCNLGLVLRNTGDFAESLAELRLGHELGSKQPAWRYPSAEWVRQAERKVALAARLPAILSGEAQPADNSERLALAQTSYSTKRYASAARLWAEALRADPSMADDLRSGLIYDAACAAALAGCGKGQDEPPPDGEAKAALRRQALAWLEADLVLLSKRRDGGTDAAREEVRRTFTHWKRDPDLSGVRDPDALAALPEAERDDWRALWADVDRLLDASKGPPLKG